MWPLDLTAVWDLPPTLVIVGIVGSVLMCLGGIVNGFARARRRDALAATAEASIGSETPPLVEGADVVLSGIVRHLEDHDVAVKVTVTQEGSESESSGSWSHSWTEIDRAIVVAPFLLELAGGEVVRVAPPGNVDVADALDQKVWINRTKRVLSAELVPGEHIYARGRLQHSDVARPGSAYRDNAWGWELQPADGQMLLSSEPLGAGLRTRARFHRRYAWLAIAALVVTQLSLLRFYQRAGGETVSERIDNKRYYQTTDSDGDTDDHYVIYFGKGRTVEAKSVEIDDDDYERVNIGDTVPIRRASATNWNLGAAPTVYILHGIVVFSLPVSFWILYASRRRRSRPWFRRKVDESHAGRLPAPE